MGEQNASVLLMASTGMRVGALPDIILEHLRRWNIRYDKSGSGSEQYVYRITVYANSPNHKYQTFCTPRAAKIIYEYLEFRKSHGDKSKGILLPVIGCQKNPLYL